MAKKSNMDKLVERVEGFNSVTAWRTPNGELVILLSHRNTNDEDVIVRVRTDDDVIVVSEVETAYYDEHGGTDDPWEDENCQLGKLNKGGDW